MNLVRIASIAFCFVFANILLADEGTRRVYYFPECKVGLSGPSNWYGYNESHDSKGLVYLSRQRITEESPVFLTGLTFRTDDLEKELVAKFQDSKQLADAMFVPAIVPPGGITRRFPVLTSLGTYEAFEISVPRDEAKLVMGVLKAKNHNFSFLVESRETNPDEAIQEMLNIIKDIQIKESPGSSDSVIHSIFH